MDNQNTQSLKCLCPKCGNPELMYWCRECECSQDNCNECDVCGHAVTPDMYYHHDCDFNYNLDE